MNGDTPRMPELPRPSRRSTPQWLPRWLPEWLPSTDWLEITAAMTVLASVACLLLLLADHARAEPPAPRGGFQAGPRTFTNPFANNPRVAPPGEDDFFADEEEEEIDFSDNPPTGFNANPGGRMAAAPGAQNADNGIPMGGSNPVINRNNTRAIHIDTDSGEGSREQVTDFNFPDADIMDIAKTLGKLTGKNFILDKDVKGRITIISNSAVTVGDAWRAFLTALDINGFALIPSGNFIRIARQRDARDKQLGTYTTEKAPATDMLITRVFQLKYIDADEVARTFRSFMPANSRIIPYPQTNTVIVTDTGANIGKLDKMLTILDVEGFDAGIEVIPVKYASAMELSKLVDSLIPGTGSATAGGPPRFGGPAAARAPGKRTKEGGIINTIIADDRTNTLIVHANSKGTDQVRALVAKLDQKVPAPQGGGKVHVIYLQFADAEQIATTLNNLSSQAQTAFRPITTPAGGGTGVNPVSASLFEGAIKVSPDKATNSLVVTASPADFLTVERVVNQLDIARDEVFVEVVIMEVTLSRQFQFSTNVVNPTSGIAMTTNTDLYDFLLNPASQKGAILGFKSGGTVDVQVGTQKFPISSVQGMVKLLQTNANANVLATPQIIALDNTEATFESAEKIPVPTSTAVQGAGVSTSVGKESVSLMIKIKPQINKVSNFVKLDVEAKLADISNRELPAQVSQLAFATIERNAKTTVVVGDSDTVVLGGLMRDKMNETVAKVPILGDIPLLGWLFRSKNSQTEKTNLLIFLTPHIVRQYEKVRAVLDKKLKERDDFLEKNAGGNDPLREKRDDIIRSLPNIEDIKTKRQTSVTLDGARPAAPANDGLPFTGSRLAPSSPAAAPTPAEPANAPAPTDPSLAPPEGYEAPPPPVAPVEG